MNTPQHKANNMDANIQILINKSISNILKNSSSENKLKKLIDTHDAKVHFVPRNYRIFGGILQSINIQFGNFLEEFMTLLIKSDGRYAILEDYSAKKAIAFSYPCKTTQELIIS